MSLFLYLSETSVFFYEAGQGHMTNVIRLSHGPTEVPLETSWDAISSKDSGTPLEVFLGLNLGMLWENSL